MTATVTNADRDMYKVEFSSCDFVPGESVDVNSSHDTDIVASLEVLRKIAKVLVLSQDLNIEAVTAPVPLMKVEEGATKNNYTVNMLNVDDFRIIQLFDDLGTFEAYLNDAQLEEFIDVVIEYQ